MTTCRCFSYDAANVRTQADSSSRLVWVRSFFLARHEEKVCECMRGVFFELPSTVWSLYFVKEFYFLPNSVASDRFKSLFIHVCLPQKTGETWSFSKSLYYSLHFNVIQPQDSIFQFLFDCSLNFKLWFAFKLVLANTGSSWISFWNWKYC